MVAVLFAAAALALHVFKIQLTIENVVQYLCVVDNNLLRDKKIWSGFTVKIDNCV